MRARLDIQHIRLGETQPKLETMHDLGWCMSAAFRKIPSIAGYFAIYSNLRLCYTTHPSQLSTCVVAAALYYCTASSCIVQFSEYAVQH